MKIIDCKQATLGYNELLANAIERAGSHEQFMYLLNSIYNKPSDVTFLKTFLIEQVQEVMSDVFVIVYDQDKYEEIAKELELPEVSEAPMYAGIFNTVPCIYINVTAIRKLAHVAENMNTMELSNAVLFETALQMSMVSYEQMARGDLVLETEGVTWKGKFYSVDDVAAKTMNRTLEIQKENPDYDEADVLALASCELPWEHEIHARTVAGLSMRYTLDISNVKRQLVDDWVTWFWESVVAIADEKRERITQPILMFPEDSYFDDIKNWVQVAFSCDVNKL